jgi:hypothetical protein
LDWPAAGSVFQTATGGFAVDSAIDGLRMTYEPADAPTLVEEDVVAPEEAPDGGDGVVPEANPTPDGGFAPYLCYVDENYGIYISIDDPDSAQYDYDDTPLELNIPVEAWVPVHAPSDPSVILGGFALCDQYGSPVHRGTVKDFYQQLNQGMSPTSGAHSQMLGRMRSTLLDYGYRAGNGTNDVDAMLRMFTGIVEEDIKRRLKNGVSGDTATLSSNDEIYRIMFARACAQMQTQLIYIPKRFMTYFTFDVDEKGVGRSLLTLTKTMSSIRATVDMANFFATVRNSTNYRKYTLAP